MIFVQRILRYEKPLIPLLFWVPGMAQTILDNQNASLNSVLNMINFAFNTPICMEKPAITESSVYSSMATHPPSLMFLHRREFKNPWIHSEFDQK